MKETTTDVVVKKTQLKLLLSPVKNLSISCWFLCRKIPERDD